jgi:hypothetical protein
MCEACRNCEHAWQLDHCIEMSSSVAVRCVRCGATRQRPYAAALDRKLEDLGNNLQNTYGIQNAFSVAQQNAMRNVVPQGYTPVWSHKPTVTCGCESCLERGLFLDAQLAQHRVSP